MNYRLDSIFRLVGATMATLVVCGACSFNEPQPQPDPDPEPTPTPTPDPEPIPDPNPTPDPVPDPINTNGPVDPVDTNGVEEPAEPGLADLVGTWRVQTGFLLYDYVGFAPTYLQFLDDGSVTFFGHDPETLANQCLEHSYRELGEGGIVIEIDPEDVEVDVFLVHFDGFDSLTLLTADSGESTFVREPSVPTRYACHPLQIIERFETDTGWRGFGELGFDGQSFWFNSGNSRELTMVSTTGEVSAPIPAPTPFSYLLLMEGPNFWTHRAAADDETIKRFTNAGTEVESINTEVDLMAKIDLATAAIDPESGNLWLHGYSGATRQEQFLQVDQVPEPDVLIQANRFDLELDALSIDGGHMWAIYHNSLLQIDMATLEVAKTYRLPAPEIQMEGVVAVNDKLYVLGAYDDYVAVILEVSTGQLTAAGIPSQNNLPAP